MNPAIANILQQKMQQSPQARITFAAFMEAVLYDPMVGYYSAGNVNIGSQGDFYTATSLGADFGELLAEQLMQMREILQIEPFQIVEMGAGKGDLAKDILSYMARQYPDAISKIEYIIIEKSPALGRVQQNLLANLPDINIRWCGWDELADNSIQGCFLSNELVDAFPVHLLTVQEGQLREVYLHLDENRVLQEIIDQLSTEEIATYFARLNIDFSAYPEGYRTEVNLQMLTWLETISQKLKKGYLLTIDYGYSAAKYYHPQRYSGTLKCYFQHRHHDNPYLNLGQQDMTTHVDFTTLQSYGEQLGLMTLGCTQQGLFLMALGLGDRLNELSQTATDVMTIFRRRDALHQLIDPSGLGGFYVLLQAKNLDESQLAIPLSGLTQSL